MQAPPPVPQADVEGVAQSLPLQQPFGQLVALQAQAPFTHCWPLAHAGPEPQAQVPSLPQRSALVRGQATHAEPAMPHAIADGATQLAPEQQPEGQLCALHPLQAPPAQPWPDGQAAHAEPPAPHAAGSVPARHCPPEQQPAHEPGMQAQEPLTQASPGAHAGPPPQPARSVVVDCAKSLDDMAMSAAATARSLAPIGRERSLGPASSIVMATAKSLGAARSTAGSAIGSGCEHPAAAASANSEINDDWTPRKRRRRMALPAKGSLTIVRGGALYNPKRASIAARIGSNRHRALGRLRSWMKLAG